MMVDGSALVAAGGDVVKVIDLAQPTPSVTASYPVPTGFVAQYAVATSDGKALLTGGTQWVDPYVFDPADGSFTSLSEIVGRYLTIYQPILWRSPDASWAILGETYTTNDEMFLYSPGQRQLSAGIRLSADADDVVLSRDLQKTVFNGLDILDDTWSTLASLPMQANAVVFSSDGNTAYGYYSSDNTVRAYDISNPGAGVPLLASGAVASTVGTYPEITISPDDATLFVAGGNGMAVVPVGTLTPQ